MTYAKVVDGTITEGRLPESDRHLETGQWVMGLREAWTTEATRNLTGWYTVVDTPRPADTATDTHDRTLELVAGVPTVVWQQRPWTVDELAARQQEANRQTIEQAIDAAITKLDTLIAAGPLSTVAAGTLTTAQLSTALRTLRNEAQATRAGAQDVALILKRTIKLLRGDYDTTD